MSSDNLKSVSIIVSVYNEQAGLNEFWNTLKNELENSLGFCDCEVIFVNDGSKDNSQLIINDILNNTEKIRIKSVEFSRNFGHEAAMIAGIDHSASDFLICMDADLQHPPSMLAEMISQSNAGAEIVLMNRIKREDQSFISKVLSSTFYLAVSYLSDHKFEDNASDFFLISRDVANVLKNNFRERNRFLRGYIQIIGFNVSTIEYEAPSRFAGKSNYNFRKLLSLGFTAIFAFSDKPLRISLLTSFLFLIFSIGLILLSLYEYLFGNAVPSGYTTLIITQSLGFTILSFLISILSIYFGKSLSDIKDRPIYIIKNLKKT